METCVKDIHFVLKIAYSLYEGIGLKKLTRKAYISKDVQCLFK